MSDVHAAGPPPTRGLAAFIRQYGGEIIADWETTIRALPITRELSRPVLRDHLPVLLSRIAEDMAEPGEDSPAAGPDRSSLAHALERLEEGYNLGQVVTEYAVLRECILRHWEERGAPTIKPAELRALNRAIDQAIATCVAQFTSSRDRTLQALDRISAAALGSTSRETFLPALLLALKETTPAIDWAALLLREADRLIVRAAVGLEEDETNRYSVAIDEGFAGLIAGSRAPQGLRVAAEDLYALTPATRAAGTRTMFGVPMIHDGEVIGVAVIGSRTASDFSDEDNVLLSVMATRATAMLAQHNLRVEAERRAAEAEHAMRARDEVLAIVSHDLRNPLHVLMIASTMLGRAPGDAAAIARKMAVIHRSAERMSRLIEDLLDASQLDAGGLVLDMRPQALEPLVAEAVEQQSPLADEKSMTLITDLAPDLPRLCIDGKRLLRVLANLIDNAIKFTPARGVITVRAVREGARVRVCVVDTGRGIDPDHLPRVFDRFWRVHERSQEGGAGLGLAIVKGIVEAHGGEIRAESRPGAGSTFSFTLTIADG